MTASQSWEGL